LSLQYALNILGVNLKAIGFCNIALTDVLEGDEYKSFLDTYQNCIVKLIEQGYLEDFEDCPEADSLKLCWA